MGLFKFLGFGADSGSSQTLASADALCREWNHLFGVGLVETQWRSAIKSERKLINDAVKGGVPPKQIALTLLMNAIYDDLSSGRDHVYRGVLGVKGEAKEAVWQQASNEFLAAGWTT